MLARRPFAVLIGLSLAAAATAAGAAQAVHVDLTEPDAGGMAIMASATTVPAGTTTFEVSNKAAAPCTNSWSPG